MTCDTSNSLLISEADGSPNIQKKINSCVRFGAPFATLVYGDSDTNFKPGTTASEI